MYFKRKVKETELGFISNFNNPFRKNKKTISFADHKRIKKASKTPTEYTSTRWIISKIFFQLIKDFNHLDEEKFCLNGFE